MTAGCHQPASHGLVDPASSRRPLLQSQPGYGPPPPGYAYPPQPGYGAPPPQPTYYPPGTKPSGLSGMAYGLMGAAAGSAIGAAGALGQPSRLRRGLGPFFFPSRQPGWGLAVCCCCCWCCCELPFLTSGLSSLPSAALQAVFRPQAYHGAGGYGGGMHHHYGHSGFGYGRHKFKGAKVRQHGCHACAAGRPALEAEARGEAPARVRERRARVLDAARADPRFLPCCPMRSGASTSLGTTRASRAALRAASRAASRVASGSEAAGWWRRATGAPAGAPPRCPPRAASSLAALHDAPCEQAPTVGR